jgi:hypothetical protein
MRYRVILLILVAFSLSCKKKLQEEEADMFYTLSNETILSSNSSSPLIADVNNDGVPDYGFSFASVTNSSGTHLYALESSYNGSTALTGATDNAYSGSGSVSNYKSGDKIDGSLRQGEQWKADFGVLAARHTNGTNITYDGNWANETEQMMSIKLDANGHIYFGWIRLKYSKTEQKITLVDFAYNRLPERPVTAGQK